MNIFVIVVGAFLGSQFLAGVHAKLYQPVVIDTAISYGTVWDFARECDRRNGSLPEIANDQDLKDFTSALSRISWNLLDGKKFYLGISRWDDVLNGDNNRTYTDPETGSPLPMPDKNFWVGTNGLPSNGDGSKEFFTMFWSSGGIFSAGSKLNDAEAKNSYSAILACSLNAPKRTCPPPPRHPAAKLAIWINAPSQDAQEYPYGTKASYWCPLGFAMSHTAMLASSTRSIEVQCYGALGWGPATVNWEDVNRPVNMTCVLEPRTIWVIMNGAAGETPDEYMFVYQANKQGFNASSVMEANKQYQYSAAWLYGLETFKGVNNTGKPPSHVNFVGTNFTLSILDTLDFYAAAGHKVALALNIRAEYDAEADIQAQYAIVQSAWQKVSQRIGRPILDPLLPEGDTNQKLCSIYASDENGTIGIQPVSCTSPIDGTQFQLCHRFEQGCTLDGNQPLPFFIRNSSNSKVTFSTPLDPLLGYPISTKASYTCAGCGARFDRPVTTAPSVTCEGSMGWEPIEGLPRCISNAGRDGVNMDAGPVFKAVPPNATNFSGTFLAAANLCNSQQPGAGLVTINSKEDLLALQDFLNATCFQGMLPIGNNILSADPIGSMHTNVTLKSAWNATFTAFAPPWFAGFPAFNQTGNQGMCAVLRSRTDASTNRLTTWGLENFPCESTATASFLLCQNGTGVCSTMRVNDTTTTVNYTDPSGALNETHFPHGVIANIHCKRSNNWWKSSYAFNKPRFICYGSMGWYPRITDDCAGLPTCEYKNSTYSMIRPSFDSGGTAANDIISLALRCYEALNGTVVEHRNASETREIISACKSNSAYTTGNYYIDYVFLAPTAWDYKDLVPTNTSYNGTQVDAYWRYQSNGRPLNGSAQLFLPGHPAAGQSLCLVVRVSTGLGQALTLPCPRIYHIVGLMCKANSSEASCFDLPRNPTNGSAMARVTVSPSTAMAPYPFGTVASYTCPCGYKWIPEANNTFRVPYRPRAGNDTTINVTCMGTIGWTTYDLTNCIPENASMSMNLSLGTFQLFLEPFNGTVLQAADICYKTRGLLRLPHFATPDDIFKADQLLRNNSNCLGLTDIPTRFRILAKLTPSIASDEAQFRSLWGNLTASMWHADEPVFDPLEPAACAFLTLRNGTWKLAAKSCHANFSSPLQACMGSRTTNTPSDDTCQVSNLVSAAPSRGSVVSLTNNYTDFSASVVVFGTKAVQRCPCGQIFKDTQNTWLPIVVSTCTSGTPLGWFPEQVAECVEASFLDINGISYKINSTNSSYGITTAAEMCSNSAIGSDRGWIAEPYSQDQLGKLSLILISQCQNESFIAPTAWKNMTASLLQTGTALNGTKLGDLWAYSNGSRLPTDLPFAIGEPNNALGREQCLKLQVNATPPISVTIVDAACWNSTDRAVHICASTNNGTFSSLSDCQMPLNPTLGKPIEALIDTAGGQTSFPFGSTVNFVCPEGYSWTMPPPTWPTDPFTPARRNETIMTTVSAKCLGTLGWTLYNVTQCQNATVCGPLPPVPDNVLQNCSIVGNGTTLQCSRKCIGGFVWRLQAADQYNVTCNSTSKSWVVPNDTCVPPFCDPNAIRNFTGVNLKWDANSTVGAMATYSCPLDSAFGGDPAAENRTNVMTCNADRNWSTLVENLQCLPIRCDRSLILNYPNVLSNTSDNLPTIGSSVTYKCPEWHAFDGNLSAVHFEHRTTCLANGSWSFLPKLTCLPVSCDPKTAPDFQGVTTQLDTANTSIGSFASYSCPLGQAFDGDTSTIGLLEQSECLPNGTWHTFETPLQCLPVQCNASLVQSPEGVQMMWNESTQVGSTVEYICGLAQRMLINGTEAANQNLVSTCQSDGKWSLLPPNVTCKTVGDCDPKPIEDLVKTDAYQGRYTNGSNRVGEVVYVYFTDYTETWTCLKSLTWDTVQTPKCE